MTIRIIIADDHHVVREGLDVMIKKIGDIEIVAEAATGEELVQLTRRHLPDVILTDVKMPKMDGIQATAIIKKEFPHIGVIALSSFDEESLIMDMIRAGAKGYLLKNASKQEISDAVKTVYRDEPYYCKHIKGKVSEMVARGGPLRQKNHPRNLFTERELEVIALICEGLSSKQIADQLKLKTRSIERYRDTIMSKMDVKNAAGVVTYAFTHRLRSNPTGTE